VAKEAVELKEGEGAMKGRKKSRNRGVTLVLITTIGAIVSILGLAMIHLGYHSRMLAARNVQSVTARCAADAGMADAIFQMQKKIVTEQPWDNTTIPTASNVNLVGANSEYSYTISGAWATGYQIDATGTNGPLTRMTHTTLLVGSYWEGIGVRETVDVKVNSSFGVVGPGLPSDMVIRTNSTKANSIILKSFVTVPGDIVVGPGGDPAVVIEPKDSTVILGECYPATETLVFPDVQPPANMAYMGSLTNGLTISTPGRYQFDTINIPNGDILSISAGVVIYVTGKMTLNQSAEVIVESTGSLELYLGTSLEDKNSTGFSNLTDLATSLKIYGLPTCTDIDLKAKSTLAAAVYAPDADISLYNSGDFIGAITGNSFDMKNSGNFYFDTRLMYVDINDPAAVFVVGRWWEN